MAGLMESIIPLAILGSIAGSVSGKRRSSSSGGLLSMLMQSQLQEDQTRASRASMQDEYTRRLYNTLAEKAVDGGLSFKGIDPSQPITSDMVHRLSRSQMDKQLAGIIEGYAPYADKPVLNSADSWSDVRGVLEQPEFREIARKRLEGDTTLKALQTSGGLAAAGGSGKGILSMLLNPKTEAGASYDALSEGDRQARDQARNRAAMLENLRRDNTIAEQNNAGKIAEDKLILSALLSESFPTTKNSVPRAQTIPEATVYAKIVSEAEKTLKTKIEELTAIGEMPFDPKEQAEAISKLRHEIYAKTTQSVLPRYDPSSFDYVKLLQLLDEGAGIEITKDDLSTSPKGSSSASSDTRKPKYRYVDGKFLPVD